MDVYSTPSNDLESKTYEPKSKAYVVPCASAFRDRVLALANTRQASPADLARAVLLLVSGEALAKVDDPGDPPPGDREHVPLRSGASKGRVLKRKPRLQLRLPGGLQVIEIRRALALALSMAEGESELALRTAADRKAETESRSSLNDIRDENEALRGLVNDLATPVLDRGIQTRGDALFVLGFPPTALPDTGAVRRRWRRLAMIYHPDSAFGDHERMSQLNQALQKLS